MRPFFGKNIGGVRRFIKAKSWAGETVNNKEGERVRAADTYRSVYKHNKSFFLPEGCQASGARQGVAELGCVFIPSLTLIRFT
jgi:hypothetical protein